MGGNFSGKQNERRIARLTELKEVKRMAKGDLNVNRQGPRTKGPTGRKPAMLNALFGTDEEIAARGDDLTMVPGAVNPAQNPTAFNAIKPERSTAKSVNRAPLQYRRQGRDYNEGPGP